VSATYRLNDCAFIFHVGRNLGKSISRPRLTTPESLRVKLPVLKFKCRVAAGDSLGFELKDVCSQD
jgi:hypothetical protein